MRRHLTRACAVAVILGVGVTSSVQAREVSSSAERSRPLRTAVMPIELGESQLRGTVARTRAAGATFIRVILWWQTVAPAGSEVPAVFDARNPRDTLYRWSALDKVVRAATAGGLQPIVDIVEAPVWAQEQTCTGPPADAPCRPSPGALADFATAAALRYSGRGGFPRVRYWQVWNEPNLDFHLRPQTEHARSVSPGWYRDMVNAMAQAVHSVHRDNVVVAGGLAPFGGDSNDPSGGAVPDQERIRPLEFMRQMLCMSKGAKPKPTCKVQSEFDVWAHHPYTYGGPTHSAFHPDDVSLGDLGEMRKLLEAAEARGHIQSRQKVGFWVTEFSYDSGPADPKGLPPVLHARWVSEALYRMWNDGVSLVTWFLIRDQTFPQEMFQSGLYTKNDRPKLALRAFRFPFVAFWEKNGSISYWGRTPTGVKKAVVVEQKAGKWRRVAVPAVDRYGIFSGEVENVRGSGSLRARLASGGDFSQPFSLTVPKDFRFCPWGSFC